MGRAWHGPVSIQFKSRAFKGLILNTTLAGLEAEVLRDVDYVMLDASIMGLSRKVAGRLGSYVHGQDRRQHTNKFVRELMGFSNVKQVLRTRRPKWLRSILEHPDDNVKEGGSGRGSQCCQVRH